MRWIRRIAIVLGVLVALVITAGVGLFLWKPWVPPVQMTDPAPQGRRIAEAGLIGNYFPPAPGEARPAILLLGGSEGALSGGVTRMARSLNAEGYAVLHVAYFRAPGQPKRLELVPLETFDRALAWLKVQPGVDPDRVAVVGGSKGAEAALVVATRHPELTAVAAGMPSSVVWPGIDWETFSPDVQSSWSLGGRALPALPYGPLRWGQSRRDIYDGGLKALSSHPEAAIPIERFPGPVLLVCGGADTLWPSCPMSRQLAARGGARVTVLEYPGAGHGVFGTPVAEDDPRFRQLGSLGGTPEANAAARADGWPKTLVFLKTAFNARPAD